jgi:hypothetical protein
MEKTAQISYGLDYPAQINSPAAIADMPMPGAAPAPPGIDFCRYALPCPLNRP